MAKIRKAEKRDRQEIKKLLNEYLSFGLATDENVEKSIIEDDIYVVEAGHRVVGMINMKKIINLEEFLLHHKDLLEKIPKKDYYTISTFVLDECYRSGLLSYRLSKKALEDYQDKNMLLIGWVQPSGWMAETLALKFGFDIIFVKEDFWYEDSIKNDYGCIHCEKGCRCAAKIALYKKRPLLNRGHKTFISTE